jgi:hypothetical protein
MGHSRGGEGVVLALHANAERSESERHAILGVYSLAPIDRNAVAAEGAAFATVLPWCDGDVWTDRGIQLHPAFVDELHDEGGGEELGDGADLEEGVGGDLDARGLVDDAGRALDELIAMADGEGGAGHLVAFAGLLEEAVDVAEAGYEVWSGDGHG